MITGWFCGTFGFFGMKTDNERLAPQGKYIDFSLNIPGVVMAMVSLTISLFIKPEVAVIPPPEEETEDPSGFKYAKFSSKPGSNDIKFIQVQSGDATEEQNTAAIKAKFEGFIMAIVAGVFFGVNFNPCIIVQDTQAGASQEGMDYVFSHFSGVFVASTVYFLSYCAYQMYHGLKPDINPLIAFPGWLSGFMWAIAQTSWFIALTALPVAVCFPLISIGPGLVGSLWGVFAFGEITGTRNYLLLVGVFLSITVAATLIVMSQKPIH